MFFLRCQFYSATRAYLLSNFLKIYNSLPTENDEKLLVILLYSNINFDTNRGKYGPKKLLIWTLIAQWFSSTWSADYQVRHCWMYFTLCLCIFAEIKKRCKFLQIIVRTFFEQNAKSKINASKHAWSESIRFVRFTINWVFHALLSLINREINFLGN